MTKEEVKALVTIVATPIRLLILLISFPNLCASQSNDSINLNTLIRKNLNYVDENGNMLYNKRSEAYPIKVVVYSTSFYKSKKTIKIEGRVIDPSTLNDTTGVFNFIFLSTPVKNTLTKIRNIGITYQRLNNDLHENKFPYRTGDFTIEFKFSRRERLFFNNVMTFPIEFDIGRLLE